jgi:hypothetical protein
MININMFASVGCPRQLRSPKTRRWTGGYIFPKSRSFVMPVMYGATKKGKLEVMLRHPSTPPLTKKEMQEKMKSQGVDISMSSIRSAIEEWAMNRLISEDDRGAFVWNRKDYAR